MNWLPAILAALLPLQIQNPASGQRSIVCTATVVRIDQPPRAVTESHCLASISGDLRLDGMPFVRVGELNGIVMLEPKGVGSNWKEAKVWRRYPSPSDTVWAVGFAFGSPSPSVTRGTFLTLHLYKSIEGFFDINLYGGMSGGPIVDDSGRLLTLVRSSLQPDPSPRMVATSLAPAVFKTTLCDLDRSLPHC